MRQVMRPGSGGTRGTGKSNEGPTRGFQSLGHIVVAIDCDPLYSHESLIFQQRRMISLHHHQEDSRLVIRQAPLLQN